MFVKNKHNEIIAEVIDNYLPEGIPNELETTFLGRDVLWSFQQRVTNNQQTTNDCFFAFIIWRQPEGIVSQWFEQLVPIVEKLNYKALLRIKANMYPSTEKLHEHDPHEDYTFNNKSAIYYVNSNNGFTVLEDGSKIESVKNRLLIFDGSRQHYSTNCTDAQVRVTLNFNFL